VLGPRRWIEETKGVESGIHANLNVKSAQAKRNQTSLGWVDGLDYLAYMAAVRIHDELSCSDTALLPRLLKTRCEKPPAYEAFGMAHSESSGG
jgi:hypothetical protein